MHHRIGILTGGGDVPGLNSVIKEVVYRGTENHCEIVGIRRGWEGLTHLNPDDPATKQRYILPLNRANTRTTPPTFARFAGPMLPPSRTNPTKMKALPPFLSPETFAQKNGRWDLTPHALKNLEWLKLEYPVATGGGRQA